MITRDEVCCEKMWNDVISFKNKEVFTEPGFEPNFLKSPIRYEEASRKYSILLYSEMDNLLGCPMEYCPYCGTRLPEPIGPDYYLLQEYGYDYIRDEDEPEYKAPPEEFKTDEWWKKRGL